MKKIIFSALAALAFVGVSSCSTDDNSSDIGNGIDNGNGGITPPNKKILVIDNIFIESIDSYDGVEEYNSTTVYFKYDDKRLVSLESAENDLLYKFIYDDKGIVKEIESTETYETQDGHKIEISKHVVSNFLGLTPFNFGKKGKINTLDKGNVVDMTFYSLNDKGSVEGEYKTVLKYDNKPFAAFHTLNTTGAIDLSKKTQIDLGVSAGAFTGIDYANKVLPVNNPTYLKHALVGSEEYAETTIKYNYDNTDYPVSFEYVSIEFYKYEKWNNYTQKYDIIWNTDKVVGTAKITYKELK